MRTCPANETLKPAPRPSQTSIRPLTVRPALLHWIDPRELEALRAALAQGALPTDFVGKLGKLAGGDLRQRFIAQNCRGFAALLMASATGAFPDANPDQCERLLRVLAYVRTNEDAVPDYWANGLTDDQQEVLAAIVEMGELIQAFKAWRLRHQVPEMWAAQIVHHLPA